MAVTTTISPGPTSTELDDLAQPIESHPIWAELRGLDTYTYTGGNPVSAADPTGYSIWSHLSDALSEGWDLGIEGSEYGAGGGALLGCAIGASGASELGPRAMAEECIVQGAQGSGLGFAAGFNLGFFYGFVGGIFKAEPAG